MAGVGRLLVGGGAVLLGYTITNNALNKVMNKIFTIISLLHPRLPRLAGSPPDDWMRGADAKQEGNQHRGKQLFTD